MSILPLKELRRLNSNLRACVAHHKVLDSTLGPHITTQRPLFNSTQRVWTAPRVALENTIGPWPLEPLRDQ